MILQHNTWYDIRHYPCEPWEQGQAVILYDADEGIKPGSGNRYCYDDDPSDKDHTHVQFQTYGCCGHTLNKVSHFMIMPTAPVGY